MRRRVVMKIGDICFEKYQLVEKIYNNQMNTLYLAKDIRLGNRWLIKRMIKEENYQVAEADILKTLKHPNIPLIVDLFEDEEALYLIREFAEGINLEQWRQRNGPPDQSTLLTIATDIAGVLAYLHTGLERPLIYRDLKPTNIIIDKNLDIKLVDFGIARYYQANGIQDTMFLGTKGFAPVEQFGLLQSDEKTDIYAFGMTLYYLISQHQITEPPYECLPIERWCSEYDRDFLDLVYRCVDPERKNRPDDFGEIIHSLKGFQTYSSESKMEELVKNQPTTIYLGLRPGLGNTFLSLYRSLREAKQGQTALIDLSENQQLVQLAYCFSVDRMEHHYFRLKGVDIYPQNDWQHPFKGVKQEEYQRIIIDGGSLTAEKWRLIELLEIERKVVISNSPLDNERLDEFVLNKVVDQVDFVVNMAEKEKMNGFNQLYPRLRFEAFPYCPSLFELDDSGQWQIREKVTSLPDFKNKKRKTALEWKQGKNFLERLKKESAKLRERSETGVWNKQK